MANILLSALTNVLTSLDNCLTIDPGQQLTFIQRRSLHGP